MTDASPLQLDGLTKRFDRDRLALDGVSLAIPTGSVTGLLGRNASGKSTLIQCAVGLLKPTAGQAVTLGQPAWSLDAADKSRLGYVPQTIQLHNWMRVRQLLDY